jgi:hypothetical protein
VIGSAYQVIADMDAWRAAGVPIKRIPPERMSMWPVDKRVGNVKNDDVSLSELLFRFACPDVLGERD